jgi:aspartate/methionine/tyrosine aminotransferase
MGMFETIDEGFLRRRAALKWAPWGADVISLSVADIDFKVPGEIKTGIFRALEEDRTPYGQYSGDPDVLEVVCEKLNRTNRIPASPEDVHMIPGTMFAIFLACYYALGPGDEALICPAPVYPPFMENVENARGVSVFGPLDLSDGLRLDLDDLRRRITPRTRLLMVCNPNNPTGKVLSRNELEAMGRLAQEYDMLLFVDELYEDTVLDGKHVSLASLSPELFERTLTVFGFSKAFGIAGYRIAYLVNRGRHMRELRKRLHGMIVHTDTLAQAAAKAALTRGGPWLSAFRSHLSKMRDIAIHRLARMPGVWCPRPQATPFVFPNLAAFGMNSRQITDYLAREARVIVESGANYGPHGEGHIRMNIATAPSLLEEALDRIEAALKKLG